MELLRRGFQFLSDDTAAVGARDYRIYPLPFPIKMHENGMNLFQEAMSSRFISAPMVGDEGKQYIIKELPDIAQTPFHFDCLICLYPKGDFHTSSGCEQGWGLNMQRGEQKGSTYAIIDNKDEEMVKELGKNTWIKEVKVSPAGNFYKIEIVWEGKRFRFSELEDICFRYNISLFTASYERSEMADYQLSPLMERISNSEVALELLKRFRGGITSASLHEELKTNPGLFLMKMGELGKDIQGYSLSAGRLREMADRVCDLV